MSYQTYIVARNSPLIQRKTGFTLGGIEVDDLNDYVFNFALYADADDPVILKNNDFTVYDAPDPDDPSKTIQVLEFEYLTPANTVDLKTSLKYRFSMWASLEFDSSFKQPIESGIIIISDSAIT